MRVIRPDLDPGKALRIALVAPPVKAVPPVGYGGTERVVAALAAGLVDRGHDVTVFASGDSQTPGRLVPIVRGRSGKPGIAAISAPTCRWRRP